MDPLIRLIVIVGGIAAIFVLLFLNKYVAEHYWLAAAEDADKQESLEE